MLEIPLGKDRHKNMARCGDDLPCYVCGKRTTSKRLHYIHVWYGSHAVTEQEAQELSKAETAEGVCGDLGWYPIGASCLRKYPQLEEYTRYAM